MLYDDDKRAHSNKSVIKRTVGAARESYPIFFFFVLAFNLET